MSNYNVELKIRPGLPTTLFLIFLILKLCGVIVWSWWWVFAPIWIPFLIILGFFFLFGLALFVAAVFS